MAHTPTTTAAVIIQAAFEPTVVTTATASKSVPLSTCHNETQLPCSDLLQLSLAAKAAAPAALLGSTGAPRLLASIVSVAVVPRVLGSRRPSLCAGRWAAAMRRRRTYNKAVDMLPLSLLGNTNSSAELCVVIGSFITGFTGFGGCSVRSDSAATSSPRFSSQCCYSRIVAGYASTA